MAAVWVGSFVPELSQSELLPQLASYPAGSKLPRPPHHQAGEKHLGYIFGGRRRRHLSVPITEESRL